MSTNDTVAALVDAGAAADIASATSPAFDPGQPFRCSPSVALRPEPFGALVYHFGTRKLSFLKTPELVVVVRELENHPDVHAAIEAAGVPEPQRPAYLRALAGLAGSGTIERRSCADNTVPAVFSAHDPPHPAESL